MKKYLTLILIIAILISLGSEPISVFAQTNILQKTIKSIEDLINVKDENAESLAFRIQTLKQVIELSISEVKELKIKLLDLDKLSETNLVWQQNQIEKLNAVIEYYENQRKLLAEQNLISLEWIKNEAQIFKEWRENKFLPLADSIIDFLLIQQQQRAIETAQERFKKITRDLQLLEKKGVKNLKPLSDLLAKAETSIKKSVELNEQANILFWNNQNPTIVEETTTTTTTTTLTTTSSPNTSSYVKNLIATSTEPIEHISPPLVRDLVRDSLNKIKETYQIFIEMSSLVRKLLILR